MWDWIEEFGNELRSCLPETGCYVVLLVIGVVLILRIIQ